MKIVSLNKSNKKKKTEFEWLLLKPHHEPLQEGLILILGMYKFNLEDIIKIAKNKSSGVIYGTYYKMLN